MANPKTIQQILELAAGNSSANIPNGRILRSPGAADHNLSWGWCLDPYGTTQGWTRGEAPAEPISKMRTEAGLDFLGGKARH